MTMPMKPDRRAAQDALFEAALLDDRIGYVVLVAVRDASGQVVERGYLGTDEG